MSRTAGRSEHRLFPGVPDPDTEVGAVTHEARQRLRSMVQVQDRLADALASQPEEDASDERVAIDRHGRFRADVGERAQPRAETGRQDEGGRDHRGQDSV